MPAEIFAAVALVVLGLLAVFQIALALGAPLGHLAWGGQHEVLPARLRAGSVVSVVLYALFAAVIADRAGLVDLVPDAVASVGTWILVGYFALGIVMNAISRSVPERWVMVPVCAVLAGCCVVVALSAA